MQTWTVLALEETVQTLTFIALNADIQGGRTGSKQQCFSDMVELFFLPPGTNFSCKSMWKYLADKGYIREFHHVLSTLPPGRQDTLNLALRAIFHHL
jgi:hypothetical protein